MDVYRGKAPVQKNIISFGAYVTCFPQLIAGPIVTYSAVAEQMDHRRETMDSFAAGVSRFVTGLGKKVLLANNIGLVWSTISAQPAGEIPILSAWLGIIAFAFQIYFDFSGYSDMAIGLGKMMGFTFPENFDHPYQSQSITEFWRRWHMTLGSWFRDYLYIPLGGNRCGRGRWFFNLMVVWLLTGFWHGASWNFMAWGIYFGIILILEKLFLLKVLEKLPHFFRHLYAMLLVLFSWVIFAFDSITDGFAYFKAMFGMTSGGFANNDGIYLLLSSAVLLVLCAVFCTNLPMRLLNGAQNRLQKHSAIVGTGWCVGLGVLFLISTAYLVDASFNPFLYFRF